MTNYSQADLDSWSKTLQAFTILAEHARRRETTTYLALGRKIGVHQAGLAEQHLNRIDQYCTRHNLPRLVSLVVRSDTGEPGEGYPHLDTIDRDRVAVYHPGWLGGPLPTLMDIMAPSDQ